MKLLLIKETRKRKKKNFKRTKIHNKFEKGNIYSKIKNYFINKNLIYHLNKEMVKFFGYQRNNKLRKIVYKNINIRNKNENKKFLKKKIKDFLCENEISNKYKKFDKNQNKKNLKILEKYENLNNNQNEPNFFECLKMTIETFYKEIFLKKYFEEFIKKKKKENDDNYIQKLRECSENFIEYYNNVEDENDDNENKTYLSKKRNNKSIFIIHKDN